VPTKRARLLKQAAECVVHEIKRTFACTPVRNPGKGDCEMNNRTSMAVLAVLGIGVGLTFPAPSQADADEYLAWLQNRGVSDPLANGASLLSTGTSECNALRAGRSESFLVDNLEKVGVGRAQSEDVVYAAHHYLCPAA
jgi:hypothetical protein